jgi:hypothetical protein
MYRENPTCCNHAILDAKGGRGAPKSEEAARWQYGKTRGHFFVSLQI